MLNLRSAQLRAIPTCACGYPPSESRFAANRSWRTRISRFWKASWPGTNLPTCVSQASETLLAAKFSNSQLVLFLKSIRGESLSFSRVAV